MEPEEAASDLQQHSSSKKLSTQTSQRLRDKQLINSGEKSCKKCLSVTSVTLFLSIKVSSSSHQSVSPLSDQSCWNSTKHTHTHIYTYTHCRGVRVCECMPLSKRWPGDQISDCSLKVLQRIIRALTNRAKLSWSCYSQGQTQSFKHEPKHSDVKNSSQSAVSLINQTFTLTDLRSAQLLQTSDPEGTQTWCHNYITFS